ncbi:MAG: BACON domain-containing protein [Candidatus Cryptobacteroides sp.]
MDTHSQNKEYFSKYSKSILIVCLCLSLAGCTEEELAVYNRDSVSPEITFVDGNDVYEVEGNILETVITVSSNVWWKIENEDMGGWCDYEVAGQQAGQTDIKLSLEYNLNQDDRSVFWTFAIDGDDTGFVKTLTLIQKKMPPVAWSDDLAELVTSEEKGVSCPAYRIEKQFHITSNVEWQMTCSENWCTLKEGTVTSPGADNPVNIEFADNVTGVERSAVIHIVDKATGAVLLSFKVTQADSFKSPVVEVDNNNEGLSVKWDDVGASGYTLYVKDTDGKLLKEIALGGSDLSFDLTDFSSTVCDDYAGQIDLCVRALTPSEYIFADSENVRSNSHFADNGGNGKSKDQAFIISCMRHYLNLPEAYSKGFYHYRLETNLDFESNPFPAICSMTAPFQGVFDGNGKTISKADYTVASSESAKVVTYALFNAISNSSEGERTEINNLTIENCSYSSPANSTPNQRYVANCVGVNYGGLISGITVKNCSIKIGKETPVKYTAGYFLMHGNVAGFNTSDASGTGGEVLDCKSSGGHLGVADYVYHNTKFYANNMYLGGIAGCNDNGCLISKCTNSTKVDGFRASGGITGINRGKITESSNGSNVYSGAYSGGICGLIDENATADVTIQNCRNSGRIYFRQGAFEACLGGIIGMAYNSTRVAVSECLNQGTIVDSLNLAVKYDPKNPPSSGGIAGHIGNDTRTPAFQMENCYNSGLIDAGYINDPMSGGTLALNRMYGGLVGYLNIKNPTDSYVRNCHNAGSILLSSGAVSLSNYGSAFGSVVGSPSISGVIVLHNAITYNGSTSDAAIGGSGVCDGMIMIDLGSFSNQENFAGWDFAEIWKMGLTYPVLRKTDEILLQ